jgi:hypothetical protein
LLRTIAAAVLALSTVGSVMTAATATSPASATQKPESSAAPAADRRAERALDRAEDIVAGDESPAPGARVEGTLALRELYTAVPHLDPAARRKAAAILARPTDGRRDRAGDGYTVKSRRKCEGPICLHWVPTTRDAPPSARWVDRNLATMSSVWATEVGKLNYRRPLRDLGRGGDNKFDVYLKELGSLGLYGYCAPERAAPGTPRFLATGYCVLDNDFARTQYAAPPLDSLRVTAAHEFFHAIQFAYDAGEDGWFMEATATWMEERYADDVNDNRQFLPFGQLGRPGSVLDVFKRSGWNQYGNWAFFEYLSNRYGVGFVRSIWNGAAAFEGAPDRFSTRAVAVALREHGGLSAEFARYAAGNTIPERVYPEGAAWPKAATADWALSAGAPTRSTTYKIDHLSSRSTKIVSGSTLDARSWQVRIVVDGPSQTSQPAAHLVTRLRDGRVTMRRLPLDRTGRGAVTLGFSNSAVRSVTITLANASTRFACWVETNYSCQGRPRDDNRELDLSVRAFRR